MKNDFSKQKFVLIDVVKLSETSWKEARKALKKDSRWGSTEELSRDEMEVLYVEHMQNIEKKKKLRFRYLCYF